MKEKCQECGREFLAEESGETLCEDCLANFYEDTDDDSPDSCPVCGADMEWEECGYCEDGLIDEYENDPINFAEGEELTPCQECHGEGGWLQCTALPHSEEQMAEYRALRNGEKP